MNYGYIDPSLSGVNFSVLKKYLRTTCELGQVMPFTSLSPEDKCFQLLKKRAEDEGFVYRDKCKFYGSREIILVSGSLGKHRDKHRDEGMGLVLSWLIYQEPLKGRSAAEYSCCLQTRKGEHAVALGDVFLFNATHNHAWMSNFDCAIAQITVSKPRKSHELLRRT